MEVTFECDFFFFLSFTLSDLCPPQARDHGKEIALGVFEPYI